MKRSAAGQQLEDRRKRRRAREREISRGLRRLDAAGALDMLGTLCEKWKLCDEGRSMTFEDQTMRMFQQFGLDYRDNMVDALDADRGSYGLRALDDAINDAELEAIGLYHRLHELSLLPEARHEPEAADNGGDGDNDGSDNDGDGSGDEGDDGVDPEKRLTLRRIVKTLEIIYYAKRVVLSAFQAKLAVHQLHAEDGTLDLAADLDARLGSWALRFRYIEKTNALQNLLLFLLDGAMEKRYRKNNGWMHEPIYLDGQSMYAWRPVCEVKDFVYSMLRKETAWEQWCNATASGMKNVSSAIEYLQNCHDYQLPELHKQQGVYSFPNGVYLCEADEFHRFGEGEPLSDDVVACKFFDFEFEPHAQAADWRDIPTPHLQSIMDHQEFTQPVSDWMYTLLGRLLYPLNKLDSWQVIPFFHGAAASGKCYCLDTPVLMHDGSVRMVQDIRVGDAVMGDDSTPRRVLTLARGEDDMYTLVPTRKGYPSMTVTGEHVLCLQFTNQGSVSRWSQVNTGGVRKVYGKKVSFFDPVAKTTKAKKFSTDEAFDAFMATLDRNQTFEMTVHEYLALPAYVQKYLKCYRVAVDFAVTEEPLFDPWLIGVWLGDGDSSGARFTNGDEEVVQGMHRAVEGTGAEVRTLRPSYKYGVSGSTWRSNQFLTTLKAYGLVGNKHVPHELKTSSRATRMEVLAGLLDTDGWRNPAGYYEITQKREILADDIVFIARSLGFGATKAVVTKGCMHKGTRREGTFYRVNVFGAGLEDIPLRCARKRFLPGQLKPRKDALRWGFDIVPAGRQPYYGFQTDGNERFVLGDFSVTHNSTIILKVCKGFYEALDVGVLSNNMERKFGLSAFWDKKIFVAPEIKNDLACEQAEFQSVVSGEEVAIAQKHKTAFATQWAVPGVLAGNEIPSWSDNSGSIQRRVIMFDFPRTVLHGDMKLGEKLEAEMPRIILKCNRAYLEQARAHSSINIWTLLPQYFQKTRQMLAQCVNSLEAFLASDEVVLGADLFCPMEDFRATLKSFEIAHNMKSKRLDGDFFRGPMNKYGFRAEKCKRSYRGQTKLREYIFGLDLNNMHIADDEAELS